MQQNKKLTPCNFCVYHTTSGCSAKPDSAYCTEAKNEYWQYVQDKKQPKVKSLRKWDRK
jgi:hypothetical protein